MVSLARYNIKPDGQIFDKQTGKPVKIFKSNKYLQCCIYDENGKHVMGVHNVVAQAYCHDWFEGCVVHHKDNNQHNNNVENLECFLLSDHSRMHSERKYYNQIMICPECNKRFVWTAEAQGHYMRRKTKTGPFCSRRCAGKASYKTSAGLQTQNKKQIQCIETGVVYESIMQASKELNIGYSLISGCVRGIHKHTHGLHFEYA